MGDLIQAKALGGKYFINQLQSQQGLMLMRGKIIGPVATELSPFYLCDLYPGDDSEIGITVQTLLSLEQLAGVYLYEDRTTQDTAWAELQRVKRALIAKQKEEEARGPQPVAVFGRMPPEIAEHLGLKAPTTEEAEEEPPPVKRKLRQPRRRRKPEDAE